MLNEIADLGGIVGGAAALLALGAWMRGWFVRTIGRRRDRYERLARLGTGGQLSFFVAVLGEPPAIKRSITGEADEWVNADDDRYDLREGELCAGVGIIFPRRIRLPTPIGKRALINGGRSAAGTPLLL